MTFFHWTNAIMKTKLALAQMELREATDWLKRFQDQLRLGTVRDDFIRIAVPVARLAELERLIKTLTSKGN